jgi:hypothetical protein
MATKRKSRSKVGRKKTLPKRTLDKSTLAEKIVPKRSKKAARKERQSPDPLDALLEAAAGALALPIDPRWRPAIKANLAVNLQMAAFVAEFPMPDEAEPAPIFRA